MGTNETMEAAAVRGTNSKRNRSNNRATVAVDLLIEDESQNYTSTIENTDNSQPATKAALESDIH